MGEIEVESVLLDEPLIAALSRSLCDIAVVPVAQLLTLDEGVVVAAVAQRGDPRDALALGHEHGERLAEQLREHPESFEPRSLFAALPQGARVGLAGDPTAALLHRLRPDLLEKDCHGDLHAALGALDDASLDAVVADAWSFDQLGLPQRVHRYLGPPWLAAPGQGALALLARSGDEAVILATRSIEHRTSRLEVETEMALAGLLGLSASSVVRARATREGNRLGLEAMLLERDGGWAVRSERQAEATRSGCVRLARRVARDLVDRAQRVAGERAPDPERLN
jgi:hydroxymethylbilane synthase